MLVLFYVDRHTGAYEDLGRIRPHTLTMNSTLMVRLMVECDLMKTGPSIVYGQTTLQYSGMQCSAVQCAGQQSCTFCFKSMIKKVPSRLSGKGGW
jgi:hypothetical protein